MGVSPCSLLVLLAVVCGARGDLGQQESRLYQRLDRFCDDVEDFNTVLARKRDSLEKHAVHLRLLTDDVHKAHTGAAEDKVFWSGVAVTGDIINIAGLILDHMGKGSPYTSVAGVLISTVGGYFEETVSSSEQEQSVTNERKVNRIFREIEEDLKEITDMYYEIQEEINDLEEEDGLFGTRLHKKLREIKRKFSRLKPLQIEQNYVDKTSQLFNMVLKLATSSEAVESVVNSVTRKVSTDEKISTSDGMSEKNMELASGEFQVVPKKNRIAYSKNALKAVTAAASLYQDGKKLYKGILHLNKGARSELAENLCEVTDYLESVIQKWDRFLPKRSPQFETLGRRKRQATDL